MYLNLRALLKLKLNQGSLVLGTMTVIFFTGLSSISAESQPIKTVTAKVKSTVTLTNYNYTSEVSFELLNSISKAKAFNEINKSVSELVSEGCGSIDQLETESDIDFDHYAQALILAENADYVSYKVNASNYCGGVHPNHYTYHLTFNSQTGVLIDFNQEVPKQNFDGENLSDAFYQELNVYQEELAHIIVKNLKPTDSKELSGFSECWGEEYANQEFTNDELVTEFKDLFPTISGLDENKKVVIKISPPHVMAVCTFSISVPYSDVSQYIRPQSILHQWLK